MKLKEMAESLREIADQLDKVEDISSSSGKSSSLLVEFKKLFAIVYDELDPLLKATKNKARSERDSKI